MNNKKPSSENTLTEEVLAEMGLTQKEAQLYSLLLSIGAQSASVLARKMNLGRSTAQFLAESLTKKGFSHKTIRKKITYYDPLNPKELPLILETQKNQYLNSLSQTEKRLEKILPLLVHETTEEAHTSKISLFEGSEGIRRVCEDALTAKGLIRTFFSMQGRHTFFPEYYFPRYRERRAKKGIPVKAIYPNTPLGKDSELHANEYLKEARLVDHKKYDWEPEIRFYDDKVTIISSQEHVGIIIESKAIAQAMKTLFDIAWDGTEKKKKR